jgi:hypothetical protein
MPVVDSQGLSILYVIACDATQCSHRQTVHTDTRTRPFACAAVHCLCSYYQPLHTSTSSVREALQKCYTSHSCMCCITQKIQTVSHSAPTHTDHSTSANSTCPVAAACARAASTPAHCSPQLWHPSSCTPCTCSLPPLLLPLTAPIGAAAAAATGLESVAAGCSLLALLVLLLLSACCCCWSLGCCCGVDLPDCCFRCLRCSRSCCFCLSCCSWWPSFPRRFSCTYGVAASSKSFNERTYRRGILCGM